MLWSILTIFTLWQLTSPVYAQDINQYQSDLAYQQDTYNQSYNTYLEKKQINDQYNTITSEKELLDTIKTVLTNRNQLLIAYVDYLRASLDVYKNINPSDTADLQLQLSSQSVWLKDNLTMISQIDNIIQLNDFSTIFANKYYTIQTTVAQSRIQNQINHHMTIISQLKDFILKLRTKQDMDQQAQNWLNQIETNLSNDQQNLDEAKKESQPPKYYTDKFKDSYPSAKTEIDKSSQTLNQVIQDLQSLIKRFS